VVRQNSIRGKDQAMLVAERRAERARTGVEVGVLALLPGDTSGLRRSGGAVSEAAPQDSPAAARNGGTVGVQWELPGLWRVETRVGR
jgi:hypothetical protein